VRNRVGAQLERSETANARRKRDGWMIDKFA
jgi:hypothetical protein